VDSKPEGRDFPNWPLDGERMRWNDFFSKPYVDANSQMSAQALIDRIVRVFVFNNGCKGRPEPTAKETAPES
jgi:hypothetical protein